MSLRSRLQAAVSRRTSEIVKDREDARAGSRKEAPAVNGRVRMVQERLQSPARRDSASAGAKPHADQTEAAAASQKSGSASPTKGASPRKKKSDAPSKDMTPEERQRLAAMAYIQQQEAAAIAAVKSQKTKKKRTSQPSTSSEQSPAPTSRQQQAVPPPMSVPSAPPQNWQPAVKDAGAGAASAAAARRKFTEKEASARPTAKSSEAGQRVPPPTHQAVPPPKPVPAPPPQTAAEEAAAAASSAAAARRKFTEKEASARPTAKSSEAGQRVPPPTHQAVPPPKPVPAPPQQTAAEEAAAAASSAAAARKKILEKEQSAIAITDDRQQVGRGATLRLKTSPEAVQNGTASVPGGQNRASRSVALSKPLSPGPDGVGPDFASPSSLSLARAAGLFRDLFGLLRTQLSSDGRLTYAEIVDGLGKRQDIAAQLGLPTKTAQEYHLRRLFKCAGPASVARGERVDSDAFANYFASGGKATENGTPTSACVPKLWKAGLTPRDDQQSSDAQADPTVEGADAAPAQKDLIKELQEPETKPDQRVAQERSDVKFADQAASHPLQSTLEPPVATNASITATLIRASVPFQASDLATPPPHDDKDSTAVSEVSGRGNRKVGPDTEQSADEQVFRTILEKEKRVLREQMEAERRSMQEEVAAARAAQMEAEERAKILKNVLSHARHKQIPAQAAPIDNQNASDGHRASPVAVTEAGDDVRVELILKTEISEMVGREEEFMAGIASDVATAAGCNRDKVRVQMLRASSAVAEVVLLRGLYSDGRRPMDAVRALSSQLHEPSSLLRSGKYTHTAAGLRLRNPEPDPAGPSFQQLPKVNGEEGNISREEWIEKFGAALEDAVNRSSVDRSSQSSMDTSHNNSFTGSVVGDKSANRSFGNDGNDPKRDFLSHSNRDSCVSNRSIDSDASEQNMVQDLVYLSSLGEFVDTAVNESLGDLEMRGRVNGDYRTHTNGTTHAKKVGSESIAGEDCMEMEGERSKIKEHVLIESILFGGDGPFENQRNGKEILDDIQRPDSEERESLAEFGSGKERAENVRQPGFFKGAGFHPSLKNLESKLVVSQSHFRHHDSIREDSEAALDSSLEDALDNSASSNEDATHVMQFGDAGTEQSTKYVEFALADPHASSLPPPSLPPTKPLPTPSVTSATASFNAEDAQKDLPAHVDTSILSSLYADGGSGRSSSVMSTGYPSDKMSGERGSFPLQSSFWERVKAIGADHSPSAAEETANRLMPVAVPSKLAASSPRVLRHHPVIPRTSHESPRAMQGGLRGRMDEDSGEGLSSSETGMLRGSGVAAGSVVLHQDAEGVKEDVNINFTINTKDEMQREMEAAREHEATILLPSSAEHCPPNVPSSPPPRADMAHDTAPEWNVQSDLWRNESASDAWLCGPEGRHVSGSSSEAGQEVRDAQGGSQVLREGASGQTFWSEPSYAKAQPVAEPARNVALPRLGDSTYSNGTQGHSWDFHSTGASWIPKEFASYLGAPAYDTPTNKAEAEGTSAADQGIGRDYDDHLRAVRQRTFSKVPDSLNHQDNILLETFLVIPKDTSSVLVGKSMGILPQRTSAAADGRSAKVSEVTRSAQASSYVTFS